MHPTHQPAFHHSAWQKCVNQLQHPLITYLRVFERARHTMKSGPKAKKPKRKLSAAGRAAIVAALKKRWAAKKAAAK